MAGGFFVRNVSRSAEARSFQHHFVDGDVLTRNVQIERLLAAHRARCHPAGRMASPTDLGNPSEAELGPFPRPAPPRSDEDWKSHAAPMLGLVSFGRFWLDAAAASSSSSSTDPPGAAPSTSIPQVQPSPCSQPMNSRFPPQPPPNDRCRCQHAQRHCSSPFWTIGAV